MSADCCPPEIEHQAGERAYDHGDHDSVDSHDHPWWRDHQVQVPLLAGLLLVSGLVAEWADANQIARSLFWAALLVGGSQFIPGAVRRLWKGRLGIGLLMTISAIGAVILGYIEEAAALAFLYSIAEALEHRAMEKASAGLRSLLSLVPSTATILVEGRRVELGSSDLEVGQTLVVRPGERVATDGIVLDGFSSIDTSAITGESIPVDVAPGELIAAGSINLTGALQMRVVAAGTDNSLTTIVNLVEQAQLEKGERARLADRIARPLIPGVVILATLVGVIGSLAGDPSVWVERALVVLVAASPCALAIAVPVTVVSGIGAASKFGVIIKSGATFERLGDIRKVAVDKTGTLTLNRPQVIKVIPAEGWEETTILDYAAALEAHSTHPLANAITITSTSRWTASAVTESSGEGLVGTVNKATIRVGSRRWLGIGNLEPLADQLEREGVTIVVVHRDEETIGIIGIRDELRPEAPEAIAQLKLMDISTVMLTGDNNLTATALATTAGIPEVHGDLRPEDKARIITQMSTTHPTAMIGDGINDAPALAAADVGIAMGAAGSDAAIESAGVAFTGHDLTLIPQALRHARRGKRIINQNIILSLAIIAALLPLATVGVLGLATVVLIHEVAEVVVIGNGLRAGHSSI